MTRPCRYASTMSTAQIQEQILDTLKTEEREISMAELVEKIQNSTVQSAALIRAAALPLIMVRRVEFTPDRKLRLISR